jgi:hypothetical protein
MICIFMREGDKRCIVAIRGGTHVPSIITRPMHLIIEMDSSVLHRPLKYIKYSKNRSMLCEMVKSLFITNRKPVVFHESLKVWPF